MASCKNLMKSEIRNPNSERNPKSEIRNCLTGDFSDFGFRPSFGFRISGFSLWALLPLVLAWWCSGSLWAQTSALPSGPLNRYLLVIETSRKMQERAPGVFKTVEEMMKSGMGGQLRSGDTVGIWTFNDDLHAGQFPLQRWSSETAEAVTARALQFVQGQKFERPASLGKVLPALEDLVRNSEFITVIFISTGEERIEGTPFDNSINQTYEKWRSEQQKTQMPFVTVLRARRGKMTHYSLSPVPWPIQMPPLPAELQRAELAGQKVPATTQKLPPSTVPSLIVHGKKAAPAPVQEPLQTVSRESSGNALTNGSVLGSTPAPRSPLSSPPTPNAVPATNPTASSVAAAADPPQRSGGLRPGAAQATATHAGSETSAPASRPGRSGSRAAPGQPAVGPVPVSPVFSLWTNVWFAGLIAALAGLGIVWLVIRRSRPALPISLITRSLDHHTARR